MSRFAKNLRRIMVARGFTAQRFDELLHSRGFSNSPTAALRKRHRIMSGVQCPNLEQVEAYAEALRVSPAVLAWGSHEDVSAALDFGGCQCHVITAGPCLACARRSA